MNKLLILFLGLTLVGCQNGKYAANTDSRVPRLSPPVNLVELHVWRDGGSLGFVVSDQSGTTISFLVDGKINSTTKGYIFLNTVYMDKAKGIQLPLGGKEESQLLSYLSSWLDSNFDRKKLDALFESPDFRNMPDAEFKAYHVKGLLENRQRMLQAIKGIQQSASGNLAPRDSRA